MLSFSDKFVVRTPLLPYNPDVLSEEKLLEAFNSDQIKEAIYLASPNLFYELEKLYNGKLNDKKEKEKLILSFAKYYCRMQSRCTPYGLFAACSVGDWGSKNLITFDRLETSNLKRCTRPDMNFLCSYSQKIAENEFIRPHLLFYPNNSMYEIGDRLRYVEYKYINNKRNHQISSVEHSYYLKKIIDKASNGAYFSELVELLKSEEIDEEEARVFINEILASQILISELEPAITGVEFTFQLTGKLRIINEKHDNKEISKHISFLEEIQEKINEFDKNCFNKTDQYQNLYHKVKSDNIIIEENHLFQVDLFRKDAKIELKNSIKDDILECVQFLNTISPATEKKSLDNFIKRFYERYEDAEVPLLQVMDTETGLGYISNDTDGINELIDDILIQSRTSKEKSPEQNQFHNILIKKYLNSFRNGEYIIRFNDEDIKDLRTTKNELPLTMAVMFKIIDNDEGLFLKRCGGSSAANLLGRFAHGNAEIGELVRNIAEFEKQEEPDKIFAEIVHLPESRIGNILLRPVFREYEIPYLAKSSLKRENQILPSDLLVSVKQNKIFLRSKTLGKEIIPRLSTAHNYSFGSLPVYHFLCDLQTQNIEKPFISFDWGIIAFYTKFLPRVVFKNTIVSEAMWNLKKEDFEILRNEKYLSIDKLNAWRFSHQLPQYVVISEGDNELVINFNNELSVKLFLSLIKKKEQLVLTEYLFEKDRLVVMNDVKDGYTNECIAFLYNKKAHNHDVAEKKYNGDIRKHQNGIKYQRRFSIGDEWVYFKLYCGIKSADRILVEGIKPLIKDLNAEGLINGWFFIRYADPNWHIRLRFKLVKTEHLGMVIHKFKQHISEFEKADIINKTQLDTYNRELERYENPYIAEDFFCIDSEATLDFLESASYAKNDSFRWKYALKSIDDLLDSFNFNLIEKLELMKRLRDDFVNEHGDEKFLKIQLDLKFRKLRSEIEQLFNDSENDNKDWLLIREILTRKKDNLRTLYYRFQESNKGETNGLNYTVYSYIHMMLNRIFNSRQRTCEMVVYDVLYKQYKSRAAREKKANR